MSVLAGVICHETARYSMFTASLASEVNEWSEADGSDIHFQYGHNIADNSNALVHEMYRREKDWLWMLGDDHAWTPGLLGKLLDRSLDFNADIVAPLCLQRNPPYRPVAFTSDHERLDLDDYPDGGLVPVWACGSGGMLISRRVFDGLDDPWFEVGAISSVQLAEDIYFCRKAEDAGYVTFVDLDVNLGHCTTAVVWPVREPDGWTYAFSMMGGFEVTMPPRAGWEYADTKEGA